MLYIEKYGFKVQHLLTTGAIRSTVLKSILAFTHRTTSVYNSVDRTLMFSIISRCDCILKKEN